jgi:type IV secretory pathway TraG/TraD family ATPase VirD4
LLDVLPKLKKVRKVIDLMTLARSKGGRVIYSIQTLKQLSEVYGKEGMYTILDTSNTLFIFKTTDANELENILGKQEVLEYSESRTWGPHDMRDGGSHSKQKKTKPLVLASDIQRLKNGEFYIKSIAPDITKAKLKWIFNREEKYPMFVPDIEQIQKRSIEEEDSETDESKNRVSADDFMDDISSL